MKHLCHVVACLALTAGTYELATPDGWQPLLVVGDEPDLTEHCVTQFE